MEAEGKSNQQQGKSEEAGVERAARHWPQASWRREAPLYCESAHGRFQRSRRFVETKGGHAFSSGFGSDLAVWMRQRGQPASCSEQVKAASLQKRMLDVVKGLDAI